MKEIKKALENNELFAKLVNWFQEVHNKCKERRSFYLTVADMENGNPMALFRIKTCYKEAVIEFLKDLQRICEEMGFFCDDAEVLEFAMKKALGDDVERIKEELETFYV